ncbi:MAG TPA: KH domain-containing protein [Candidatus Paceibacterota bacterium]|nr:KH domain-containing protein [Candidatus Paceibacterota bacterium]
MEKDQEFLEYVVKALVDHPEDVVIERRLDNLGILLTLTTHPEDMGKIIGKNGKTADALRVLLHIVGMKHNARVNFKINEPVGGKREAEFKTVDQALDELGPA